MPGKGRYDAFKRVGFEYGSGFQGLRAIRTDSKYRLAAADVAIGNESGLMKEVPGTFCIRRLLMPASS